MDLFADNMGNHRVYVVNTLYICTSTARIELGCVMTQDNPDPMPTINERKFWKEVDDEAPAPPVEELRINNHTERTQKRFESGIRRVKELPCFAQVHEWILEKVPLMEIVKRIKDMGYWPQVSDLTGRNYVHYYKTTIPKTLIVDRTYKPSNYTPLEESARVALHYATQEVIKFSSHMGKMNEWIEMQHARIKIAYEKEKQMGFLMSGTHKEFKEARELLKTAIEIKEKMFKSEGDSGLVPMQSAQAEKTINQYDLDNVYEKEGLSDVLKKPESRMKILNTIDRLLSTYQKIDEAKDEAEVEKEAYGEVQTSEIKPVEEAVAEVIHEAPPVEMLPPVPGGEAWKEIDAEVIYQKSNEPVVTKNPWVDPTFNPENFVKETRRAPG